MNEEIQDLIIRMERKNMLVSSLENFKFDILSLAPSNESIIRLKSIEDMVYGDVSLENLNVSLEALEGEQQNLLTRLSKSLTNVAGELGDMIKNTLDVFKDYDLSSINYLVELENKLKNNKVELLNNDIIDSSLNKKLAIYFSMYKEFNANDFSQFIDIPNELFLKQDLIDSFVRYANEYLIEERSTNVPNLKNTIDIVDNIHINYIREWLHKDTKIALINRLTGPTVNVMTLSVDRNNEATFRNDHFRIESSYYDDKVIRVDKNDMLELISACKDSSKHFMENMLMIKRLNYDALTTKIESDAKNILNKNASKVDTIKRVYRNVNVICNVIRSLQLIDIYMMQSNIELYKVVEKICKLSLRDFKHDIIDKVKTL